MKALIIALAMLGQNGSYDLIEENAPRATIKTAKGSYRDDKVAALADARAKVRAAEQMLEDARAQVADLAQQVVTDEPAPRSRIEGSRAWRPAVTVRETPGYYGSEPAYDEPPVYRSYRSAPRYYSAAPSYYGAAPSYSYGAPVTYSTGAPVTYTTMPATYSYASMPATYSSVVPATYGSSYYSSPAFSSAYYGASPVTYGSSFYGASPVMGGFSAGVSMGGCAGGTCK